ncbi:MAG: TIGR00730 family Rossman fold protein [Ignavibacteria bacterium]
MDPQRKFRNQRIKDTIVFFGSAKIQSRKTARKILERLVKTKSSSKRIEQAKIDLEMSKYYDDTAELAYLLTRWSRKLKPYNRFVVCSGGGPGIMEAANLGATRARGLSIGLNISLPLEQLSNKYITDELNFEFHYFFMRKFWLVYLAKALVIMPGGYGTMDELFEILTLVQTGKIKKKMPIIIYGKDFWDNVINLKELYSKGMITKKDLTLFKFVNTPAEAFEYLKNQLSRYYIDIEQSLLNNKKI